MDENQDNIGDDGDDDGDSPAGEEMGVFEFDDGVNALNMSLDSLEIVFPIFEIDLLIFAGFGVDGDGDDDDDDDDSDFGTKEDNREV